MWSRAILTCLFLSLSATPAFGQDPPTQAGEVSSLLPQALIERGTAAAVEVNRNDPLFWRDWLETKERGRARPGLNDGSVINVGPQARVQVLALEQAAANIHELRLTFVDYLEKYQRRKLELLERGKPAMGDYPESVATTWAVNFEEVESESPASADLLRLSAFLAPDNIPLELVVEGASAPDCHWRCHQLARNLV